MEKIAREKLKKEEAEKESKEVGPPLPRRPPLPRHTLASSATQVKLAAVAVSLNVRPRSSDMPPSMQERAFRCTRALVDAVPTRRPNLTLLALALKKEFDGSYGPAWHCVVGRSFGSFVTHSTGRFVYFSLDDRSHLSFLLFQTHLRALSPNSVTNMPLTLPAITTRDPRD